MKMTDGELEETVVDLINMRGVLMRSAGAGGIDVIERARVKITASTFMILAMLSVYFAANGFSLFMLIPFVLYLLGELLRNNDGTKAVFMHNLFSNIAEYSELKVCVSQDGKGFCYDHFNLENIKGNEDLIDSIELLKEQMIAWQLNGTGINIVGKLVRFNIGGFLLALVFSVSATYYLLGKADGMLPVWNIKENIAHALSFGPVTAIVICYVVLVLVVNKTLFASANKAVSEYFNGKLKLDKES